MRARAVRRRTRTRGGDLRVPGRARSLRVALLSLASFVTAFGCEGEIRPLNTDLELGAPRRAGFEAVADGMQPSCGTLDCHGQATRNLRLFGSRGLRLDASGEPGEGETTAAEYEANFWSVIALEPEVLAAVIADGGANPERLILIRKGRETTRHKGGKLMSPGDDLDTCLVEWLNGRIAEDACRTASRLGPPTAATAALGSL